MPPPNLFDIMRKSKRYDSVQKPSQSSTMSQHNVLPANSGNTSIQQILQKLESIGDQSVGIKAICLHALYLTDPEHDREEHVNVKGRVTEGTCNWILGTTEYTQWRQRNLESTNILWICGGPGSGKTMLSIFLSKHLEDTVNTHGAAEPHLAEEEMVLYFNCDGSDVAKNSETGILRGLLFQAIRQRPWVLGQVQQIYENQRSDLSQSWSFDALWTALRSSILDQSTNRIPVSEVEDTTNCQSQVAHVIVDGLDECEPTAIRRLLRRLSRLDDDKELGQRMKILITSRERPDLRDAFAGSHLQLNVEEPHNAEAVQADVQKHIIQQVDRIASPYSKDYSAELCTSVKDCLIQNSQGNFLWVSMALTVLESTSRVEAWEHLSRLPSTLDAMYEWLVMQIPPEWREVSTKVLLWVTLAFRPLSITELFVALDETRLGLVGHETVRHCIKRCGQILRTAADDTVHFIHHSAREYLWGRLESSPSFFKDCVELNPFNLKEGHRLIASICINNLVNANYPRIRDLHKQKESGKAMDTTTYSTRTPTTLSGYAKAFWTDHFRNADELMLDIADTNPQLFGEHSPIRGVLAYQASKGVLTEDISVLHYSAYHGFAPLVERLLRKGWRNRLRPRRLVEQRDGLGRTALHLAVHRHDNAHIVKLLFDRGADLSCKDHAGATALVHAIKCGNVEMANFLAALAQKH